jgi:signal transduction histidine kinase
LACAASLAQRAPQALIYLRTGNCTLFVRKAPCLFRFLDNVATPQLAAHLNRFNVAGELAATIAHELSQPLAAILTNSETATALLDSSASNVEELRQILIDIRRDNQSPTPRAEFSEKGAVRSQK